MTNISSVYFCLPKGGGGFCSHSLRKYYVGSNLRSLVCKSMPFFIVLDPRLLILVVFKA